MVILISSFIRLAGRCQPRVRDDPSGQAFARIALHHHAGIGLMTPDQVHNGQANQVHAARLTTLDDAFRRNPERFVNKSPTPPAKPTAAWIKPPIAKAQA